MRGVRFLRFIASTVQPRVGTALLALALGFCTSAQSLLSQTAEQTGEQAARKIDSGDLNAARSLLISALKLYPRSIALHKLLATLEFKEQHFGPMRSELLRTLELDPADTETRLNLAMLE